VTKGQGSNVDRVHLALREGILAGTYKPGSRLVLSKLAAEHDVSLIPVREALQRLEAERMIRLQPNRGATVTQVSIDDMGDIYETRLVLEIHALRRVIELGALDQLDRARSALARMAEHFGEGLDKKAYADHEDFHFALYDGAGSTWTIHMIRMLWASSERYVRLAAGVRLEAADFVAEHQEILVAVEAGDADLAADKLAANLGTTQRLLRETYRPTRATWDWERSVSVNDR
jgi:DNA-binding GntR family transcriptional regulator